MCYSPVYVALARMRQEFSVQFSIASFIVWSKVFWVTGELASKKLLTVAITLPLLEIFTQRLVTGNYNKHLQSLIQVQLEELLTLT